MALLALGYLDSADKEKSCSLDREHEAHRTQSGFEVTTGERRGRGHRGHKERDCTPRPQQKSAEPFVISIIRNFS